MSYQPAMGQFGEARVAFAHPAQAIPPELAVEFHLLTLSEKPPALLADWTQRLERKLARAAKPRPWTVLVVIPGLERGVAEVLRSAGLNVYSPSERYRAASGRTRKRALLPGYVLADLAADENLDLARRNACVRDVLCIDGRPVKVPAAMVGAMILMEALGAFDVASGQPLPRNRRTRHGRPQRAWRRGQSVQITDGPFAGFMAEIVKAERADRIELLVQAFGRATPLELDELYLLGDDE